MKILVVGAGFAGAVMARKLADAGHQILILESRNHLAGNAFDEFDEHGILVHRYGPHIFHTQSKKIFDFLSLFTNWRRYEHRVLASVRNKLLPIPINRTTLSKLYDKEFSEVDAREWFDKVRVPADHPKTSEEVVLNSVGIELCDLFFRGYTQKQWGLSLSELSSGVAARIPTRTNDDDRYFTDEYQAMPSEGYAKLFEKLLDHPAIQVKLSIDYFQFQDKSSFGHTVYSGPIDRYFKFTYGHLPYRSLNFVMKNFTDIDSFQPAATINHPNEFDFTRVTEMKKLTGQICPGTTLVYEFPTDSGEPYYPIPTKTNEALYKKYQLLVDEEVNVTFVGRLAEYRYFNMDQVVGSALDKSEKLIKKLSEYE